MPQHIAKPNGPGDFTEWTPINVSSGHPPLANWQAVSTGSPNQYVIAMTTGKRDRYAPENLPADAATVSRVTVVAICAGDDVGQVRFVLRLGGVESHSIAFTPPNGGNDLYLCEFPLAPGDLPWTVARRNAVQFGPELTQAPGSDSVQVDECYLATDYEPAVPSPTPTGEVVDIAFPSTATQDIAFPGISEVAFPSRGVVDVTVRKSS